MAEGGGQARGGGLVLVLVEWIEQDLRKVVCRPLGARRAPAVIVFVQWLELEERKAVGRPPRAIHARQARFLLRQDSTRRVP
jgi:hypothetical protein